MISDKKAILGYWSLAGNGQVLRYLLEYVGAPWKDKFYVERSEWFERDKNLLGLKFANLPYLIDGNVKVTETSALIRYIPKRWGYPQLLGKTILDQLAVDTYLSLLQDVWLAVSPLMFSDKWTELKDGVFMRIKDLLKNLNQEVEDQWALKYITVVDFRLADIIALVEAIYREEAGAFKKLLIIRDHVYAIPGIKKYRETEGSTIHLVPRHSNIPV